ncbi:hypothetical protein SAMN05444148_2611 [Winogradskyella jejuensis]|uniref:Uncharacterized protein n=1 Tax=Winogradskyella jejuensis TaxID=1089305 RepID=A0A1M5UUV7_9FLAO|nr:hypothetical protein SAMN05444148_2611 [Winogradskyella jejuensis]
MINNIKASPSQNTFVNILNRIGLKTDLNQFLINNGLIDKLDLTKIAQQKIAVYK